MSTSKVEIYQKHTGSTSPGAYYCTIKDINLLGSFPDGCGDVTAGSAIVSGDGDSEEAAQRNAAMLLLAFADNLGKVQAKLLATAEVLSPGAKLPADHGERRLPRHGEDIIYEKTAEFAQSVAAARSARAERMEKWAEGIRQWASTKILEAAANGQARLMLALPGDDAVAVVLALLDQNGIRYTDPNDVTQEGTKRTAGVGYPVLINGPYNPEGAHLNTQRIIVHIDSVPAARRAQ